MFFDLNKDPGVGNLNLRAYMASIVGPRRIANSRRSVRQVSPNNPVPLANMPSGVEVMYFEVWLPQSSIAALPGNGVFLSFANDEGSGQNGFQLLLSPTQRYQGVLLPQEQIFGLAIRDALGGVLPNSVPVVVASVVF